MDYSVFYFIGVILVVAIVSRFLRKQAEKKESMLEDLVEKTGDEKNSDLNQENIIDEESEKDFSQDFYIRSQKGEKSQYFLNVSSQQDVAFIRGMLHSANIPSIADFESMNSLYGSAAGIQNMVFPVRISILCDDYDEALQIVADYVKQKIDVLKMAEPKSEIVKVAETLLGALLSKPISKSQEILGISVYPKENSSQA